MDHNPPATGDLLARWKLNGFIRLALVEGLLPKRIQPKQAVPRAASERDVRGSSEDGDAAPLALKFRHKIDPDSSRTWAISAGPTGVDGHPGNKPREVAKPGGFLHPCIGRIYHDGYTEIVSTGLELMWRIPKARHGCGLLRLSVGLDSELNQRRIAVAIQVEGTKAIIGLDPDMSMTWTSDDLGFAHDLNRYSRNRTHHPNEQLTEAQAVVAEAIANGKHAFIVMVDQVEETDDLKEVVY